MDEHRLISRYISIIQRLTNPYFDRELQPYHIGGGQQFFLLNISKNQGISFQELAAEGHYDKATATRAVRKLEEQGYVRLEPDPWDKRIRHIYITGKAEPVIEKTWSALGNWMTILTAGFGEEEKILAEGLLERMAGNAKEYLNSTKEETGHGTNQS